VVSLLELSITKQLRDYLLFVEMEVKAGEILVMAGKNGSGKTTTLNLIAGLMSPADGHIQLSGTVLFDRERSLDLPVEERRIGYIFQNAVVFPYLSVFDNVAYGLRARGFDRNKTRKKVDTLMNALHIDQLKGLNAGQLSGGQKQLVIFARALAIDPALLLLDEPFRALDRDAQEWVNSSIYEEVRSRKIPCIIVTHNREEVQMPDVRLCLIDQGRIIEAEHSSPGTLIKAN